ncbi:hypothetical protein CY0110_19392 [Crocosphaera chwakensis CCY0110]|uniref:Uncharacterized protein n=1 Tax=Crocosphaera chwakensis CCY0110 TaxID=391612 RepID=A3IJL0_9CHRO|nr:hypothetical protein CY0110_19392 [Crocosphaera chwakensis CCY0110]
MSTCHFIPNLDFAFLGNINPYYHICPWG